MEFWDCHAGIGRWTVPPPAGPLEAPDLVAEMAHARIARALVHHGLARDYDAAAGNEALLREVTGLPDLIPCATLLPHHTGEFAHPRDLLPSLIGAGVRAVRLYPKSHRFSLEAWCAGSLLAGLEAHHLPLSIDFEETSWSEIHALCTDYPALPVVVTRVNYRQERYLYALWERHATLHVESSLLQQHRGIEQIVDRFGPERLLFGTGLPYYAAGAPILMVVRADIGDAARQAIASGNLRRLLEAVTATA